MGYKKVRAHGLHIFLVSAQLTGRDFDAHLLLDQTTGFDWTKVDVPDAKSSSTGMRQALKFRVHALACGQPKGWTLNFSRVPFF